MISKQDEITKLGFRDVTEKLKSGDLCIKESDVIRGVSSHYEKEQNHNDGSVSFVYYFKNPSLHLRGRIFPLDEVIVTGHDYDVIVQRIKSETIPMFPMNVDVQVYHDFNPGEQLAVRITRVKKGNDPSFKLFNHITGFVKNRNSLYDRIREGDVIAVDVEKVFNYERNRFAVHVKPLDIIIPAVEELE